MVKASNWSGCLSFSMLQHRDNVQMDKHCVQYPLSLYCFSIRRGVPEEIRVLHELYIDRLHTVNQPFPNLRCIWDRERTPVYSAYKPLWAHKYHSHYREVCEHFVMPLYTLIFLKECNCMLEEALQVIEEYADYYNRGWIVF